MRSFLMFLGLGVLLAGCECKDDKCRMVEAADAAIKGVLDGTPTTTTRPERIWLIGDPQDEQYRSNFRVQMGGTGNYQTKTDFWGQADLKRVCGEPRKECWAVIDIKIGYVTVGDEWHERLIYAAKNSSKTTSQ